MKTLAIIPARGGSKGIVGKNVAPVNDKPLITWMIEAALAAQTVDRVVVSTDNTEIEETAWKSGVDVVPRPGLISGDDAPSELALLHVLGHLKEAEN